MKRVGEIIEQMGIMMQMVGASEDGRKLEDLGKKIKSGTKLSADEEKFLKEFVESLDPKTVHPNAKKLVEELKDEYRKSTTH